MTLAMVRPDQISMPDLGLVSDFGYISPRPQHASSLFSTKHYHAQVTLPKAEESRKPELLFHDDPASAENSSSPGILSLFRRNSDEINRRNLWSHIQAGYGQIWTDESMILRGKNGTAWEEPGCGYFKATFTF